MADGWLITDSPYTLYKQGRALPIPILGGSVTDEGTIFVPIPIVNMVGNRHLSLLSLSHMQVGYIALCLCVSYRRMQAIKLAWLPHMAPN